MTDIFWRLKQFLARPGRYYGDGGTIHRTGQVDVEVTHKGEVVSVWFRCQPLPFRQSLVSTSRADEMRHMYSSMTPVKLTGVEVQDDAAPR